MELNLTEASEEVQQAKSRFGIAGNSPALVAAIQRAVQVAPINLSVLIVGESGTGKEFFPKIIHNFSPRKHSKYIAVNCGAIPEGTIDSELFGHEKGAFTGAVASRKGYFEEADKGTIFLDEVAELPMTTQARLLRVLETGEYIRVGSSEVQKTDIRIVAATNVDMQKAVAEGHFREDLYYRLSTVMISVPPLRDRGNDILLLARKFASDFADRYSVPPIAIDDDAKNLLRQYRWPGNVRQLKNIIEQIALFEAGNNIGIAQLGNYLPASATIYTPAVATNSKSTHAYDNERELLFNMIFRLQGELDSLRREFSQLRTGNASILPTTAVIPSPTPSRVNIPQQPVTEEITSAETLATTPLTPPINPLAPAIPTTIALKPGHTPTLEETEREMIRRSLENNDGHRKAAAKELNISERTLYRKIKEYGLE